jgi:hypothetical protein
MKVVLFQQDYSKQWDEFIQTCPMATFLHSRLFLSYHHDRFRDYSLVIKDDKEEWLGVFPAALNPADDKEIISHPGITFGAILHNGKLLGTSMIEAFQKICEFYHQNKYKKLFYKSIPYIYHKIPSSDDLYALFRFNAHLYRRDLGSTIDLGMPLNLTHKNLSKMRNMFRKAEKNDVIISTTQKHLKELWKILTTHLQEKYQTNPVHTYEEILSLITLFPKNIKIVTAVKDGHVLAGTVLFIHDLVYHTQYLVVTQKGAEVFALDYLINYCIESARKEGARYFDFGINNEQQGQYLNQGLYLFKAKHGGGGVVHDFYQINLEAF